ncbi:hypothetical protein AAG612_12595 [Citromicrobium bathyomarinum]|uniref:hypothetical protein n=1 Tax=Citromicrobium bathyomarinum TaxID=72174 RepID=UPI00315B3521
MSDSDRGDGTEDVGRGFAFLVTIVLCCLITAVLTYAWINNASGDRERAAHYQSEAKHNQETICIGRTGSLLAECLEKQRAAAREAYQAEQDLNAQRNMAIWAMWMVVVSIITAGVTVWALVYVRGTLLATREALADTSKATKAMQDANAIADKATRGWLEIKINKIGPVTRHKTGELSVRVEAVYANRGNYPIVQGSFGARVFALFDHDAPLAKRIADYLEGKRRSGLATVALAPGGTVNLLVDVYVEPDQVQITDRKGGSGIFLQAWLGGTYYTKGVFGSTFAIAMLKAVGRDGFPTAEGEWVHDADYFQTGSHLS